MTSLQAWERMWRELGAAAADEDLYGRLIACWNEPHRHYHTLQHLGECLRQFDSARAQARRPAEIELALWFHDAFYDPHRDDNEQRSAEWARASVLRAGLGEDVAARIHDMVMATCHEAVPQDADAQLLVDVDLSILGAQPSRFDESDEQIRAEFAHVPEPDFRAGRKEVLGSFLQRPRLYSTERFYAAYEQQARENLRRSLAKLDQAVA